VHYGNNEAAAKEAVTDIERAGGRAFAVRADLGIEDAADSLVAALREVLGETRLDILVNNAAVFGGTLEETDRREFDHIFAVNVRAPFFLIQGLIPLMSPGAHIVNISSGVTWMAIPQLVYSMTKGAVNVMTRSLAKTLGARGINVNAVSPGITDTDMNPWMRVDEAAAAQAAAMTAFGRNGAPSDIADAVAFFASDDARWVTGQVIDVAGGLFLGP
jgi:NAD(P)-dependent dehydrogenase (short-subunit alcohol dehydrogenase family)